MIRTKASTLLLALIGSGLFVSAPLFTAPPAHAQCASNEQLDARTGVCWTVADLNNVGNPGAGVGACMPGRLGRCLGAIQNTPRAGAQLTPKPPGGPAPRSYWPPR